MYVLVGTQAKVKDDIWAGKTTCPKCGQVCNFHLAKLVQRITVFFIPIISITQKKYLVCDSCEWAKELSGKEYKEIKKRQMEMFEKGEFPKDIIRMYCHPDNVKFVWRAVKLILSSILAAIMVFGAISMAVDIIKEDGSIISALFAFLFMGGIYSIPFMLSLKNFIPALKMKKAYDSLTGE